MTLQEVRSFAAGQWVGCDSGAREIRSAVTGAVIARAGNDTLDVLAMLDHARGVGGPNLNNSFTTSPFPPALRKKTI